MSEQLKKLTGKFGFEPVAQHLVSDCDIELFEELVQKEDFLFDFVKQNVAQRIQNAVNETNYRNLLEFFKFYSPSYEEAIISSIVKFADEDLTDEILEKFENGTEIEKIYCAKYFSYIQDSLALPLLKKDAFSENEALMMNSAFTLAKFNDKESYNSALEMLKNNDDFDKLKAVKFLVSYGDKEALPSLFDAMKNSSISENIAAEIPYLQNFFELLNSNYEDGLLTLNYIVNGLGEIIDISTVFDYELYEVFERLINNSDDSKAAIVLLNAKEKFETLTENDEYLYDEDKDTKNEVNDIKKLLSSAKNLEKYVNDELKEESPFVFTALDFAKDELAIRELLKSNNQTIILKTVEILKALGSLDETTKTVALLKVTDINIKSIIRAL